MNRKEFLTSTLKTALAGLIVSCFPRLSRAETAEEKPRAPVGRPELIAAAREIVAGQTYCALITQDDEGRPQVRTMNPFPPEEDMTVWIATSSNAARCPPASNSRTAPSAAEASPRRLQPAGESTAFE